MKPPLMQQSGGSITWKIYKEFKDRKQSKNKGYRTILFSNYDFAFTEIILNKISKLYYSKGEDYL